MRPLFKNLHYLNSSLSLTPAYCSAAARESTKAVYFRSLTIISHVSTKYGIAPEIAMEILAAETAMKAVRHRSIAHMPHLHSSPPLTVPAIRSRSHGSSGFTHEHEYTLHNSQIRRSKQVVRVQGLTIKVSMTHICNNEMHRVTKDALLFVTEERGRKWKSKRSGIHACKEHALHRPCGRRLQWD